MKNSVTCESIKKILAIEKQAIIQNIIEKLAREVVTNTDHEVMLYIHNYVSNRIYLIHIDNFN